MHFFCVPRIGLLQCKNHRQVGTHKFPGSAVETRSIPHSQHSLLMFKGTRCKPPQFYAERELSDLYISSLSRTVQTVSAQSCRILLLRLQEPTSSPPLRAPHPQRRTLPHVPSLRTNFNKKGHVDLSPRRPNFVFVSFPAWSSGYSRKNTENAARTRGSSRRCEAPSPQDSFLVHLLCSFVSVSVDILLPSDQPYHSGYISFSASAPPLPRGTYASQELTSVSTVFQEISCRLCFHANANTSRISSSSKT